MNKIKIALVGISSLLQNRFIVEENGSKKTKKVYDPQDEAEIRLFKNSDGIIYEPSTHIEASITKAALNFKYDKRKSYSEFIKSGVFVTRENIPHLFQAWQIFSCPVVVQRQRIVRHRPLFDKWRLEFEIEIFNENIDTKTLKEIFTYAGRFIGIGDYRPRHGRFVVEKFEEQ